jgi:glutaredoxin
MPNPADSQPRRITLYGLQNCANCKDARKRLEDSGLAFELVYVDMLFGEERNETMRYIRRINPEVSFPTLVVGEKIVVGFKSSAIDAALRELTTPPSSV